ncbi:MAG TPA: hypothetical protein VFI37_02625 [Gaiellaceae bacterium]|jgi:hypothetical protein|nr:hypothetical protein [Gaiellaceae bacterium]
MAKRTKSPEELEWEAARDERDRLLYGRLNEIVRRAREREERPKSAWRRLFPWRIRLERLG